MLFRSNVMSMGKICPHCNTPLVKVIVPRRRPWKLCLDPECPSKEEYKKKRASKSKAS